MTSKELAKKLNGRQYGKEISASEEKQAKASGLVVLFGASDDLAEFRGAINDETGRCDGRDLFITTAGPMDEHEGCDCTYCGFKAAKKTAVKISALWCDEGCYSWTYKTTIPHETFEIMDGSEHYCRGIVFLMSDLNR